MPKTQAKEKKLKTMQAKAVATTPSGKEYLVFSFYPERSVTEYLVSPITDRQGEKLYYQISIPGKGYTSVYKVPRILRAESVELELRIPWEVLVEDDDVSVESFGLFSESNYVIVDG